MAMWAEYLMLASPAAFPWFYLVCWICLTLSMLFIFRSHPKHLVQVTLILLMLLRYTTYRAINNHFFMIDFCYFMQISVITQTLLFPPTSAFGAAWFKANFALRSDLFWFCLVSFSNANTGWLAPLQYRNVKKDNDPSRAPVPFHLGRPLVGSLAFFHFNTVTAKYKQTSYTIHSSLSHGPIAIAILAWQNSMVFHSLDKMTSFYIHIMPPLTCYMQVMVQSCFNSSITK